MSMFGRRPGGALPSAASTRGVKVKRWRTVWCYLCIGPERSLASCLQDKKTRGRMKKHEGIKTTTTFSQRDTDSLTICWWHSGVWQSPLTTGRHLHQRLYIDGELWCRPLVLVALIWGLESVMMVVLLISCHYATGGDHTWTRWWSEGRIWARHSQLAVVATVATC